MKLLAMSYFFEVWFTPTIQLSFVDRATMFVETILAIIVGIVLFISAVWLYEKLKKPKTPTGIS